MKIMEGRKKYIAYMLLIVLAVAVGVGARKFYTRVVLGISDSEIELARGREIESALRRKIQGLAEATVRQGKFTEGRAVYREILQMLPGRDVKTVMEICRCVLQSFSREYGQEGFESALFHFRAWTAQSLPEGYEGCPALAVAKAHYLRNDLMKAADEIKACLDQAGDEELVMNAHLLAGLIHFRAGRLDDAMNSFEEVLARVPPRDRIGAKALFFVGYINLAIGNTDKAQQSFSLLVKRYPHTKYAATCKDLLVRLGAGNPKPKARATGEGGVQ